MLRGAVQKHERDTARKAAFTQDIFKPSPPSASQQSVRNPANRSVHACPRDPLRPATPNSLNSIREAIHHPRAVGGIKRTASGLAKALDGSFGDEPGTQSRPIVVNDPKTQTQVTFDENDFDSDIDLDFEEPKGLGGNPQVAASGKQNGAAQPVVYPTLPRQQQVQAVRAGDLNQIDSSYGSIGQLPTGLSPPKSSNPLSWSSSPVEHLTAPVDITSKQPNYGLTVPSDGVPARASKRRTLPWLQQGGQEDDAPSQSVLPSAPVNARQSNGFSESTPLPKDGKKAAYPWNITASSVKEQQRNHKKAAIKKHDGTEEDKHKAKSTRSRPARVFLSEEQQHVLELVTEQKKSVFFTGSAGTGKSVLLREIIASLRKNYQREPDRVAVTASTGLAACNVGGVTLHSFAGIGLGKEDVPELVRKIKRNQKAKHRWMRTKVLIIDEISMVDAELFDKLEAIARQLRNNGRPFGGIQLVITGDFFQLPPVPDNAGRLAKFAFDAATWNTSVEHTIALHHVFRQKDPVFAGMLNEMREGRLTPSSIQAFRNLNRELEFKDAVEATELFPTRNEVDRANNQRLAQLQGKEYIFEARDGGTIIDKVQRGKLLQNCMASELIVLKKGAQVMLIKNIDESLVNGSIGRVVGFMSEAAFDRYHQDEEGQDESFDGAVANDSNAIHRADSKSAQLNGGFSTSRDFPVVRFVLPDGASRDLLCQPESWKVELPNGEVQASRSQIPLILAWALSIHKAQGQTLERVKVDLGKVFEKGQAYVALSRATSMAGLQVIRFDPKKVVAHERVRSFYSNLSRVEIVEKDKEHTGRKKKKAGIAAEDYEKMFVDDTFG